LYLLGSSIFYRRAFKFTFTIGHIKAWPNTMFRTKGGDILYTFIGGFAIGKTHESRFGGGVHETKIGSIYI